MHGLPANLDLGFFNQQTLLQVCIGMHDLILNFDGNVSITVMSAVGLMSPGGEFLRHEDFRKAASALVELLNQRVMSTSGLADGTLHIDFETGAAIEIYDNSKQYESFIIKTPGGLIVV